MKYLRLVTFVICPFSGLGLRNYLNLLQSVILYTGTILKTSNIFCISLSPAFQMGLERNPPQFTAVMI